MRKLKLGIVSAIFVTYLFSMIKTTFSENIEIEIPENIYNITNGNKSIVILKDKGTDGYGLFLLSDIVNIDATTLTVNNGTTHDIQCMQKLKGYYTNNFLNFQLFPIDSETNGSNIISFTGGLYTNCKNGDQQYSGVYGHIQWTYKSGNNYPENTHEIRAGIEEGNGLQRNSESSLKLFYENNYYALSGSFQDYLAKNAIVLADLKEGIFINYPDEYFNNTKAFSGNQNEIYFNNSGNNGFGLFFLGTGIENGPYELTNENGTTLTCSGQLDGYYSFSFNDFGMLPLDQATANYENQYGTNYNISVTGGLYYNCRNGNTVYTGVYGHLKWNYNYGNIHEIRAGIKSDGSFYTKSPIEVIYSDNFRNTNRTLSGQYHDNLAKTSKTEARLFGDLGITIDGTEYKATGTLDDPYIVLPYETYKQAKIYIKSSKKGTSASLILTEFDNNGQTTAEYYSGNLNNERSNFGFYGYRNNIDFSQNASLKSGIINLALTNGNETWTQSIKFEIADPIIQIPVIIINHTPDCSTGIKVTANVTQNYGTFEGIIGYTSTSGNTCDEYTTTNRTPYQLGQVINLPENGNNGKYLCFMAENTAGISYNNRQITGIDLNGPTFNLTSWTGEECTTGIIHIENIEQVGCADINSNPFSRNGTNWLINSSHNEYSGGVGNLIITGYVQDSLGNYTYHTGTFTWRNTGPSIQTGILVYPNTVTGITPTTLYTDLKTSMGVTDGLCGASTINKSGNISCTYTNGNGSASWNQNGISVTPPNDTEGTGTCTVRFADDEGSTISGTVIYRYDTQPPHITITGPDPACLKSKTVTGSISNGNGTIWYSTGNDINTVCNGTMIEGTSITFNKESDSGTYVCFKAIDLYGNISFATSSIITNIDRTPPTFDLTTGEVFECDTGTISIINVQQIGCAGPHDLQYKRNNTRTNNNTYNLYSDTTGTQQVKIKVRDSLLNESNEKIEQITWKNHEITGTTTDLNIGPISEEYQINPIQEFGITGQGDCEIVTVETIDCSHATQTLISNGNDYTLTITPKINTDRPGRCKIKFTDGDTTITGTVTFDVKTQEYPIILEQIEGTETGELKILPSLPDEYIDTGKVSAALVVSGLSDPEITGVVVNNIEYSGPEYIGGNPDKRLKSANFDIDLEIDMDEIDNKYSCTCTTGVFQIGFQPGFVTDPAGNPSERTTIDTQNIYVAGNYLIIKGGEDTKTENTTFSSNGFTVTGYSKNPISIGTGSIKCEDPYGTCPGFSCSGAGISKVVEISNSSDEKRQWIDLFGKKRLAPFNRKFTLKIDPVSGFGNQTLWTGCTIKIINNIENNCPNMSPDNEWCDYSFTTINIDLVKRPIKAGIFGEENYRKGKLKDAINAGSGDDGFLFFITHPQNLVSGGALGNIQYTIHFSSGVADEFYYITGSAIINGFKEDLNIKRPTYNYYNPRSYKFNFPEYP